MACILFAWELGDGLGHLVPHRELLTELVSRGHEIHVVTRDLMRAGRAFPEASFHYWQAPLSIQCPDRPFEPTVTLAHVLFNSGAANPTDLLLRLTAWKNLYASIRPDVILADYSPTALLASRGSRVRTIAAGMGFCLPPRQSPLPAFEVLQRVATTEQLAYDESRVVATINLALDLCGQPRITALADVFYDTHAQWLTTIPELDQYPHRGPADYIGLSPERPGETVIWPEGSRRRVFGYLKPFPALDTLLELLNKLELPTIIAGDGLPRGLRDQRASKTLVFAGPHVDLAQMSRECDVAITNANHTTTARMLIAGKPVLLAPLQLEQDLIALAVTQRGLGVSIRPREPHDVFGKVAELLNCPAYQTAASALAVKYANSNEDRLHRMVETVERLVEPG